MRAPQPAIIDSHPPSAGRARRRRAALELCAGYAMILLVLWTPPPWQRPLYLAAAALLAVLLWLSFDGWAAMGLRSTNLLKSAWVVAAAMLCTALLVLAAIHLHTLHAPGRPVLFVRRFWGYILWAAVQQILLQVFFLRRLLILLRNPNTAALAAAAIFALAHLPNPILTSVTFVWGVIACLVFLRYRNILPLSIAHAMLGIALAICIPAPVIRNMRAGLGYLTYGTRHGISAATPTKPYPRTHE